jgi:thiosulfate/3-mercaptopyruvate sulfurtransferase
MGSRDQWVRAGRQWSTAVPEPAVAVHPPLAEDTKLLATRQAVEAAIDDPAAILLDVRAESEYGGERFWPSGTTEDAGRPGHVPGAVNVPIDLMRAEDGVLKAPEQLRSLLEEAGVTKDKAVITYCTIGNRASEAWLALSLLEYPDVRVYYGSWVEWGKSPGMPVELEGSML